MEFESVMEHIGRAFEVAGVGVIIVGALYALVHGVLRWEDPSRFFAVVRREFGRPLILGLEILVAADIIETITVSPTLESVGVLAILVSVRIALSFSLDVEIDGTLPWRKAETEARLAALEAANGPADGG